MARDTIHVSDKDAASEFASLLERVRNGAEIIIECDARPIAVLRSTDADSGSIFDAIAKLPENSTAVMDADFARDVKAAWESHREPLEPPAWE